MKRKETGKRAEDLIYAAKRPTEMSRIEATVTQQNAPWFLAIGNNIRGLTDQTS